MKKVFFFVALGWFSFAHAQTHFCDSATCYREDACFTKSDIKSHDYNYATVSNIYMSSTASVQLFMTVYSPCSLPDSTLNENGLLSCFSCKRPFIMLIHGGGFRDGCRRLMLNEGIEFAKRGYVVATIDYRLGWVPGDNKKECTNFCYTENCEITKSDGCRQAYNDSLNFAVYRALQDAAAAMRFMKHNSKAFKIDTNYMYVGGYSAGSIIAANLCYMNQTDLNNAYPKASATLGPFNNYGNRYIETYRIAGFFNNWGSIKDTSYIKGLKDNIPMIAFHGIDDSIVPFAKGSPLACKNHAYGYSTGSKLIYSRLVNRYNNLPVELYACYGGHGIFTGDPARNAKSLYRIQKAVCFFNRVRNGDRSRTYVEIDKNQNDISYEELSTQWPVNCTASGKKTGLLSATMNSLTVAGTNAKPVLNIVPNPAVSQATLSVNSRFLKANIIVTNIFGKVVWQKENIREAVISLPVKDWTAGMYIVMFKSDSRSSSIPFMKSGQ